jgi:hypothetical protein
MANTFCSLDIHCIVSTKERVPILNPELRERIWPFLGGIAKQNGITPRCIGGVADHVHLLLSLPTTVPIAKAIQLREYLAFLKRHELSVDDKISVGLTTTSAVPGRGLSTSLSRHFLPGYYHPVPPGQKPFAHRSASHYLSA